MARSLLFNVLFYVTTALFVVLGSPLLFGPRRWAMAALAVHARFELWLLKVIVGTKLEVRGKEKLPAGACLVASKHQSAWETFALIPLVPRSGAVDEARTVLDPVPRLVLQQIRDDPGRPRQGARGAAAHAARGQEARVADGREIIIFPEGTRRAPGAPPDYKTGVILLYDALGVPCVPVALNSGLFWPRRSLTRRPGTIVVEFLDPIPPGLPKAEFLKRLTEAIETASSRLLAEAEVKEPAIVQPVNL